MTKATVLLLLLLSAAALAQQGGSANPHPPCAIPADGVTDIVPALVACEAGNPSRGLFFVPSSATYRVRTSHTVPAGIAVEFAPGARLEVDVGMVFTVLGPFTAPPVQVFTGPGTVTLRAADVIYPQWYGAKGDVQQNNTGITTAGSTTLTLANTDGSVKHEGFTAADVGKVIFIWGACDACYGKVHQTTIAAYSSASSVTLASAPTLSARNGVVYWGTDDLPAFLRMETQSPGRSYRVLKTQRAVPSAAATGYHPDYILNGFFDLVSANGERLAGNTQGGGERYGGPGLLFPPAAGGIRMRGACGNCLVEDLSLDGQYCFTASAAPQFAFIQGLHGTYAGKKVPRADGIVARGNRAQIRNVYAHCFSGDGIFIDGQNTDGTGQPDFYRVDTISARSNGGNGFEARGGDANAGTTVDLDLALNQLWGHNDASGIGGSSHIGAGTHRNHNDSVRAGPKQALASIRAASGLCSIVTATPPANNLNQVWQWVTTSGVAGDAKLNGTFQVTAHQDAARTLTADCPGVPDGAGTGGSVGTASSTEIYAVMTAAGVTGGPFTSPDSTAYQSVYTSPYCEYDQPTPRFGNAALVLGGNCSGLDRVGKWYGFAANGTLAMGDQGGLIRTYSNTLGTITWRGGVSSDPELRWIFAGPSGGMYRLHVSGGGIAGNNYFQLDDNDTTRDFLTHRNYAEPGASAGQTNLEATRPGAKVIVGSRAQANVEIGNSAGSVTFKGPVVYAHASVAPALQANLVTPTAKLSGAAQWVEQNACTITRVYCSTDVGSVSINLEKRGATTPNSPGKPALSADLVCSVRGQTACASGCDANTISSAAVPARNALALTITATSNSPGALRVSVERTCP